MSAKRSSIQITLDSIYALLMREIKIRYGTSKLGYFWAFAEPISQAAILATLFTLVGRNSISGVPVALFLISGVMPFKTFSRLISQLSSSTAANKVLYSFRQVSPIDPLIALLLIELATFFVVYTSILLIMFWLGFDSWPDNLLGLITASLLLLTMGVGVSLFVSALSSYWLDSTKIVSIVMRPMFFISGIFYCATMIPPQYWYLFSWNPVFHAIELSRHSFFESYATPIGDWGYLAFISVLLFVVGFMAFWVSRRRFITS